MAVIKIKPYGKNQGDYVLIDEKDFDPKIHESAAPKPKTSKKRAAKK